jgi:hypothetical protein
LTEVDVEQPGIGEVDETGGRVGEARRGHDPVEEARVVVRCLVALVRAPGPACPDREARHTVALDEALLDHHDGLGREQIVAVVRENV